MPSCQATPKAPSPSDRTSITSCLPRTRVLICPVNCSISYTPGGRATGAPATPPLDSGLLNPEPAFWSGLSVIVTDGPAAKDPRNVMSGSIRHTNATLCPSSMSNSDEEMYELIGAVEVVVLSSMPFSCWTMLYA